MRADTDNVTGRSDVSASGITQGGVVVTGAEEKRTATYRCVAGSGSITVECGNPVGDVGTAGSVSRERECAGSRVVITLGIAIEGTCAGRRVGEAGGIANERFITNGRVEFPSVL